MIPVLSLENLKTLCDLSEMCLYFPMRDIDGHVVGYKQLLKENNLLEEKTFPEVNCFGVLTAGNITTNRHHKDVTSAVLVLNILDVLALSTQKLHCKWFRINLIV